MHMRKKIPRDCDTPGPSVNKRNIPQLGIQDACRAIQVLIIGRRLGVIERASTADQETSGGIAAKVKQEAPGIRRSLAARKNLWRK